MTRENFEALMPYIVSDLVSMISDKMNISSVEALMRLYESKLYEALEDEQTKVWHYSTPMLYSLFEQGEKNGFIKYPDV